MAKEKTLVLKVDADGAIESIEEVKDGVDSLDESLKDTGKTADKNIGKIDDKSKKASKGVSRLSGSFKKLGIAIKASGIALVASAFAAIGTIASQQQGAVDALSTSMTALQLVFNDVISGGERFKRSEGIQSYFEGIMKDARAATALLNKAAIAQAEVGKATLQSEIAAEKLRQTRDDTTKSFKERIDASHNLSIVLALQQKDTVRLANMQLEAAKNQYELNGTVGNHVKLIEAETAVLEANNKVVTANSEQKMAHNGVIKEAIDWQREYNDSINDEVITRALRVGDFSAEGEIERDMAYNNRIIENSRNRIAEIEALENVSNEAKATMKQEYYESLNGAAESNALLENDLQDVKVQYALGAAKMLSTALSDLAEEGSAEQKAFAITGVLIDSAAAVIGTWRGYSSFGPWGTAAAIAQTAAIAASTVKAISEISSADGSKSAGSFRGDTPNIQSQAPSFNIVGADGTNQIVDAINERDTQPVKAYVVSSEMSSQQALDRNTIENATVI